MAFAALWVDALHSHPERMGVPNWPGGHSPGSSTLNRPRLACVELLQAPLGAVLPLPRIEGTKNARILRIWRVGSFGHSNCFLGRAGERLRPGGGSFERGGA